MTMEEVTTRLLTLKSKADRVLKLLGQDRLPAADKEESERLARELKEELRSEFKRLSPSRTQNTLTRAESAFYYPSIHGAWVAISGLRVDGRAKKAWYSATEETRYKLAKHLS